MGYLLLAACLILAFLKPESKKATLFVLVYLWAIYALSTYTPDGVYYQKVYGSGKLVESFYYEPAYTALMMVCRWLGLSFQSFRIVLASIYIPLLYVAVRRLTQYTTYVLALFAIFPLTYFYSVLRGGFAALVIIFGLGYLVSEERFAGWKYVACVVVAMLFHTSSALFLVLLYACTRLKAKWLLVLVGGMFVGCLLIRFTDIPYNILSKFTQSERLLTWVRYSNDGDPNLKGYIGMAAAVLGSEFLSRMLRYQMRIVPAERLAALQPNGLRMADMVYRVNAVMVILLPIMLLTSVFIRYIYQMFALNLCLCANVAGATAKKTGKVKFITVASLMGLLWAIGYMVYSNLPFSLGHMQVYNFKNNLLSFLF